MDSQQKVVPLSCPLSSLLVICFATLLTIGIGNQVMAEMIPTAWEWNGHLWHGSSFKLDNSTAGSLQSDMVSAANNYHNSTVLTFLSSTNYALNESLWRGGIGYGRTVSIVHEAIQWGTNPQWSSPPTGLSSLPGSGTVQTLVNYRVGNVLVQGVWRSNQGWSREVPIVNNVVQWGSAPSWTGPIGIGGLPGSGDIQAHGDYAAGNYVIQSIWRSNQGWSRNVPIIGGVPQWGQAGSWSGPISINTLPGAGDIQAQDNYVVSNTYWQIIWRSNVQYTRYAPIINGSVDFGAASNWLITTAQENLPGSGSVQAQGNYVLISTGTNTGFLPPHVIRSEEANYGFVGFHAYTMPISQTGLYCYWTTVPTGSCNKTDRRAYSARILYNTYYDYPPRAWLSRHEMGHVFGLYHPPCTDPYTVMFETSCYQPVGPHPWPTTLQADEISYINSTY
jgi:hypothetical protein